MKLRIVFKNGQDNFLMNEEELGERFDIARVHSHLESDSKWIAIGNRIICKELISYIEVIHS